MNTSTTITLPNIGDKVYIRGMLSGNNSGYNNTRFKMTGKIAAYGNCNAIWDYQDLNAPLKEGCGRNMFNCCTSLTTAPALPATTLTWKCYQGMFNNCTKLNHIICLATDISAADCTTGWIYNAASTGTFVKHPDMNDWFTGTDGIPSGWTVEDAEL